MIAKTLSLIFGPRPWTRYQVGGIVDTLPFTTILGNVDLTAGLGPAQALDFLRRAFWKGEAGSQYVVRPNLWEEPFEHYLLPPGIRLRVGDRVEGLAKLALAGERDPKDERTFLLGQMTEIISVNGLSFDSNELASRSQWPDRGDTISAHPLSLKGRFGRVHRLTGVGIGPGDLIDAVGSPKAGKTCYLLDFLRALPERDGEGREIVAVVALIGERDREIDWLFRKAVEECDAVLYAEPYTASVLRKLRLLELCLHTSMRMAELGYHVVVLLDSATKIVESASKLPERELGILPGGVNPMALELIEIVLSIGRNLPLPRGAITVVTAALDRGDTADTMVVSRLKSACTVDVTFDPVARRRGVFPPLDFGEVMIRVGGREVSYDRSCSRTQGAWESPEFMTATRKLQFTLSKEACLAQILEYHEQKQASGKTKQRLDPDLADQRAKELRVDRLEKLYQLIDQGLSDAEIFKAFGIRVEAEVEEIIEISEVLEITPKPAPAPPPPTPPQITRKQLATITQGWLASTAPKEPPDEEPTQATTE